MNNKAVFIDTPTSDVYLNELQTIISERKRNIVDSIYNNGPISSLNINYPPNNSYKVYILQLINLISKYDIDIEYYNTNIHAKNQILEKVVNADLIIFSDTTPQIDEIVYFANSLKEKNPESWIIIGGLHSSIYHKELLSNKSIDIVIRGEGEITFNEIVKLRINNVPIDKIKVAGISTRFFISNISSPTIKLIDEAPLPNYDYLPGGLESFFPYIVSTRGCNFHCPYCVQGSKYKKARMYSAKRTILEIEHILKHLNKTNIIHISDDNLINDDGEKIYEIIKNKPSDKKIYYSGEIRLSDIIPQKLKLLKSFGVVQLNIGIESLNLEIQKKVGKGFSFKDIKKKLSLIKDIFDNKILIKSYFMTGLPGESYNTAFETIQKTIELVDMNLLDFPSFRLFKPLPGTEFYKNPSDHYIRIYSNRFSDYERYTFPPIHSTRELMPEEIFIAYIKSELELLNYFERRYNINYHYPKSRENTIQDFTEMVGKLV